MNTQAGVEGFVPEPVAGLMFEHVTVLSDGLSMRDVLRVDAVSERWVYVEIRVGSDADCMWRVPVAVHRRSWKSAFERGYYVVVR
jgi:hypothetical protein